MMKVFLEPLGEIPSTDDPMLVTTAICACYFNYVVELVIEKGERLNTGNVISENTGS
jgi:hypothetical protein